MAEKPILFSGEMVRAILDGRKTQTRRVVKPKVLEWLDDAGFAPNFVADPDNFMSPYGYTGDSLWVRETWAVDQHYNPIKPSDLPIDIQVWYMANAAKRFNVGTYHLQQGKLRSSIFMPRWASRITLKVTAIRVERLQDISEQDAIAEGVIPSIVGQNLDHLQHRAGFMALWDSINAKRGYSWDSNPWVWVVEFSYGGTHCS